MTPPCVPAGSSQRAGCGEGPLDIQGPCLSASVRGEARGAKSCARQRKRSHPGRTPLGLDPDPTCVGLPPPRPASCDLEPEPPLDRQTHTHTHTHTHSRTQTQTHTHAHAHAHGLVAYPATMSRRQNSSCDQCRKGKRACDAVWLRDQRALDAPNTAVKPPQAPGNPAISSHGGIL